LADISPFFSENNIGDIKNREKLEKIIGELIYFCKTGAYAPHTSRLLFESIEILTR
jgi:hypothetical protein